MPVPPSPDELAERIFAEVERGAASAHHPATAFDRACRRLGDTMSVVVGEAGYRAMIARSVRKARVGRPFLGGIVFADGDEHLEPLLARMRTQEASAARAASVAVLAQFIELLSTLIGRELALNFLRRGWPHAVAATVDPEKS